MDKNFFLKLFDIPCRSDPYFGNEISIDRLYKSFISDLLKDTPISMLSTLCNVLMIKQVALVSNPAVKQER